VVLRHDGPTATVLVTADERGARRLRINGQYSLGGDGLFLERREGLLPVLLTLPRIACCISASARAIRSAPP
jgi:hypothetical protein